MSNNNSISKENVPSKTIEDNLSSNYHDNNFQDNISLNKNKTSQFENPYHIVKMN